MRLITFCLIIVFFISCKKNESTQSIIVCDPTISYKNKVKALFVANCTSSGCHDGNPLPSLADYLTAHDAALQIKSAVSSGVMPKNATLNPQDKAAIICWLENGAQNN
jgi:hypothetical protein